MEISGHSSVIKLRCSSVEDPKAVSVSYKILCMCLCVLNAFVCVCVCVCVCLCVFVCVLVWKLCVFHHILFVFAF